MEEQHKVNGLEMPLDIINLKRSNLIDLINLIYKRNGYKTPVILHVVQYNKDTIREALNLMMLSSKISADEDLLPNTNQCLKCNNNPTRRKMQTPKFNSKIFTEVDYFKPQRHNMRERKIWRNYLKEAEDPMLSNNEFNPAEDEMAAMNAFHDERDALFLDETSSSIASTNSSTITVDGDSHLHRDSFTGYYSANSESMSELNDSNTESYECDPMESESYTHSSVSHEEMESEFDNNDADDENELPESQSSLNEPMEYYSSYSESGSEDMEDDDTSFEDELELEEEYFQRVDCNEKILESCVRSLLYKNALTGVISDLQENNLSS